jgi:hypothetical protein
MGSCDLCFRDTRNRTLTKAGDLLCTECREHKEYADALTAQQRDEWAAIGRYAEESGKWNQ